MQCLTPKTHEELVGALCQMTDKSKIVAGGTDFVIQSRNGQFDTDILIYPGGVPYLSLITKDDNGVKIGAMVTMSQLADAFVQTPELAAIADAAANVGSPQVRNKATLVGNLCNASPAGDLPPVALLYNASLEILNSDGSICYTPVEEFILGPQRTIIKPQQIVTALVISNSFKGYVSAFGKIGSRERVSISREGLGVRMLLAKDGTVADIFLTLGAVANTPIAIATAQEFMIGKPFDDLIIEGVTPLIAQAIHDNCRPTNRLYKTKAARGLVADVFALIKERI